jgi:hypothetical protein
MFFSRNRYAILNDMDVNSDFFRYVEVLGPEDKDNEIESKQIKALRKDQKRMAKLYQHIRRECDDMLTAMKNRISKVRDSSGGHALEYETKMYANVQGLLNTKLNTIDKEVALNLKCFEIEQKQVKLEYDMKGAKNVGGPSTTVDMRGTFANMLRSTNNNGLGINLSDPEGIAKKELPNITSTDTNDKPITTTKVEVNKSTNDDYTPLECPEEDNMCLGNIDYKYAMNNIKNADRIGNQTLCYNKDNDVYWMEIKDIDGKVLSPEEYKHTHIEVLKGVDINERERNAVTKYGDVYDIREADIDEMPEYYMNQWKEAGKFDEPEDLSDKEELYADLDDMYEEEE